MTLCLFLPQQGTALGQTIWEMHSHRRNWSATPWISHWNVRQKHDATRHCCEYQLDVVPPPALSGLNSSTITSSLDIQEGARWPRIPKLELHMALMTSWLFPVPLQHILETFAILQDYPQSLLCAILNCAFSLQNTIDCIHFTRVPSFIERKTPVSLAFGPCPWPRDTWLRKKL